MPISRHVRSTRSAISPRFAMRILWNMAPPPLPARLYQEQGLPELHRLRIRDEDLDHAPRHLRLDLVRQLHGLNDAEGLALLHRVALADERRRLRTCRAIERADPGRVDRDRARRQLDRLCAGF